MKNLIDWNGTDELSNDMLVSAHGNNAAYIGTSITDDVHVLQYVNTGVTIFAKTESIKPPIKEVKEAQDKFNQTRAILAASFPDLSDEDLNKKAKQLVAI